MNFNRLKMVSIFFLTSAFFNCPTEGFAQKSISDVATLHRDISNRLAVFLVMEGDVETSIQLVKSIQTKRSDAELKSEIVERGKKLVEILKKKDDKKELQKWAPRLSKCLPEMKPTQVKPVKKKIIQTKPIEIKPVEAKAIQAKPIEPSQASNEPLKTSSENAYARSKWSSIISKTFTSIENATGAKKIEPQKESLHANQQAQEISPIGILSIAANPNPTPKPIKAPRFHFDSRIFDSRTND